MIERSVVHATLVVERTYDASPARVFAAWADPADRARWSAPGVYWEDASPSYDFRIGGRETTCFGPQGAPIFYEATHYEDIVPNRRIVSSGTTSRGESRISSALLTVDRGWSLPWVSSYGSDFNYDFHVSLDPSVTPVQYNFRDQPDFSGELHGLSVFFRLDGELFHTYSAYARGLEGLTDAFSLLDVTPYGRQEDWEDSPPGWPQRPTYG